MRGIVVTVCLPVLVDRSGPKIPECMARTMIGPMGGMHHGGQPAAASSRAGKWPAPSLFAAMSGKMATTRWKKDLRGDPHTGSGLGRVGSSRQDPTEP